MTDLLPGAPPPTVLPRATRTRWLLATGAGAAFAAAGSVLFGLAAVTVLLWAVASHGERTVLEALRAAGLAWLLAHHSALSSSTGDLTVAPLLLTALLGVAAIRAAAWAARQAGIVDARSVATTTAGFAAGYAGLAGVVALAAGGDTFQPRPGPAIGMGLLWGVAAALLGGIWAMGSARRLPARLRAFVPDRVPAGLLTQATAALRAAAGGVLVLVGGGALVVAGSLIWHAERAGQLFAAVSGGWVDALGVLLVCCAFLPNAAVWAAAFGAGPGFTVGSQTAVALGGVQLHAVPALPLLAALPGSGPAPLPSYAAVAVPAAAGVVTGLIQHRRTAVLPLPYAVGSALAAGLAAGGGFGLLAWLSGGSVGGRLSSLGPPAVATGLAVAGELAVLAALTLAGARWWARHGSR